MQHASNAQKKNSAEHHVNSRTKTSRNQSKPKALSVDQIVEATKCDSTLQCVLHVIQNNKWNLDNLPFPDADVSALKIMQLIKHEFASADDKLLPRDSRIVIPQALQEHVVELAYEGYQGKVKTNRLLRAKVWFPYMDAKCEQQVKACLLCQSATPQSVR